MLLAHRPGKAYPERMGLKLPSYVLTEQLTQLGRIFALKMTNERHNCCCK